MPLDALANTRGQLMGVLLSWLFGTIVSRFFT
jgi:hypothetical protein